MVMKNWNDICEKLIENNETLMELIKKANNKNIELMEAIEVMNDINVQLLEENNYLKAVINSNHSIELPEIVNQKRILS